MSKLDIDKKTRKLLSLGELDINTPFVIYTSFIIDKMTDGGGIRGLSSIVILEQLLDQYNSIREENYGLAPQEPWQIFDLIGGTSTGGYVRPS